MLVSFPCVAHPRQPIVKFANSIIKLVKEPVAQYDLSTDFSIFARPQNELYEVLRVMKRIGALITPAESNN